VIHSEPPGPEIILDTNVVLSGIFFGGLPGRILDACHAGRLKLVLSPPILAEYYRAGAALAARYPDVEAPLYPLLALLAQSAPIGTPQANRRRSLPTQMTTSSSYAPSLPEPKL
jgi:hypothetical protein